VNACPDLVIACTPKIRALRVCSSLRVKPVWDGAHMQTARAVEKAFADAKKSLPINVDGAIGAILADLGMNPAAFNGIFMVRAAHPDSSRTSSKNKLARDRCAVSIQLITATTARRPGL